ncbi:DNA/pantothenate metabolism flavoprotein [Krasilnikovia cinnamomea]|uniref:DNA/pantothenate metabolism flavoprotein n=1 Tax=Krasilnikovia cinnamomea TaxID=349313 RepID=A0A4Q7ZK92_9ACTN|nr:phosphopantothenoylcysteine decarboxylase [Krasilnikovia cinnamomea]RZU50931.1 DNA/pantothenate metabolism flavoprotein [Krasilnikovia cinnamomea]
MATRITLRVGTGRDVHHAWGATAALVAAGFEVHVQTCAEAAAALPAASWFDYTQCSSVTARWADPVPGSVAVDACLGPGETSAARIQVLEQPAGVLLRPCADGDATIRLEAAAAGRPYADAVVDAVRYVHPPRDDLAGLRIVVTSGGTREPVDPVRIITNLSSGKMGQALARAARDRAAEVTLISTTDTHPRLAGVRLVVAPDVAAVRQAVLAACADGADAVIMAAAISDYRPRSVATHKVKKTPDGAHWELETVSNFVPEIPPGVLRVGFAAETDSDLDAARTKLARRGFDLLCLNNVSLPGVGFDVDTNQVTIIDREGVRHTTGVLPKIVVADRILDELRSYPGVGRR